MNYFIIKEHIKFWWNARTAHGVHSPFVYTMVTQCLRNTDLFIQTQFYTESISKKHLKLLNRILNFYDIKQISTNPHHNFKALISQNLDHSEEIIQKLKDNQFWFILNIRRNPQSLKKWNALIRQPTIDVTIDLFVIGIALKRVEQAKEHFQLKAKF